MTRIATNDEGPARDALGIEDHGVIGNLETVALVGSDGAIDFLCFPAFDSPTVFASLLDRERGGAFELAPAIAGARVRQLYIPDSNVLLTRHQEQEGVAEVSDFMSVGGRDIVRRAKTVRGELPYLVRCHPAFDYARAGHRVERRGENEVIFEPENGDVPPLRLRSEVPLRVENGEARAEFRLRGGEHAAFVLEPARPEDGGGSQAALPDHVSRRFRDTVNYWRRWIAGCDYDGRWKEMVHRSALALKLLTSARHGSIVAAPTFGLPEEPGGERNWDYRYSWIRDSAFTLYALMRLGFTEEAEQYLVWLEERCMSCMRGADGAPLQVLYRLDGGKELEEETLDHLAGYAGSRPVRIGNHAYRQLQLDVYGELLDAVYIHDKLAHPIGWDFWLRIQQMLEWLGEHWQEEDEGIWETRAGRHAFLVSRVMGWVAFDRAVRLARKRGLPGPLSAWIETRDAIYASVMRDFWDDDRRALMQYRGADTVDAASLLIPLMKFMGPRDPRWLGTLEAIEDDLVEDVLVHRYRTAEFADGLPGTEGCFSACSFWYVEALSRAGRLREARLKFEKALSFANSLGLYSEEIGLRGEHLGNFPQALTHLALISTAYDLDRRLDAARGDDL